MYKSLIAFILTAVVLIATSPANAEGKKITAPLTVEGAETIGVEKAKVLLDAGAIFVDLRKEEDFIKGHIPSAEHMELFQGFNQDGLEMLAEAEEIVVFYCYGTGCLRSSKASASAVNWGFTNIKYFREGMPAWEKSGYEIETE